MSRTAGPWRKHPYDGRFGAVITTDGEKAIAFVLAQPDPLEGEDNARLIASAGLLLDKLKEVRRVAPLDRRTQQEIDEVIAEADSL